LISNNGRCILDMRTRMLFATGFVFLFTIVD
jgi:hypothetical protein